MKLKTEYINFIIKIEVIKLFIFKIYYFKHVLEIYK